jgi:hypothetical protein
MDNNIIPTPYPRMMGGNTATYEHTPTEQKGGKRKRRNATKRRQNKKGKWTKKRR